jgi:hypothetical protein
MTIIQKMALLGHLETVAYELINLDGTEELGEESFRWIQKLEELWPNLDQDFADEISRS